VWLTFDDGPDPEYTSELLNVLRAKNVKATFFVIGEKAERHPDLLRRIVEEGHSLGNHTYRHEPIDRLSAYDVLKEVQRTSDVLRQILGKAPCRFRPPHGKLSLLAIQKLWSSGQQIVLWNSDSKDYLATSEDEILDRFRKYPCEAGDIVLWHDNRRFAAAVMSKVIEKTRARGLEFAAMDDPAFFQRRAAGSVK
jgi:peptidoglycan/xylan/chitin deacetylase (PgdA/CDA1 family)